VSEVLSPRNHPSYGCELEAFAAEVLRVFGEIEEKERMRGVRFNPVSGPS
jgi:hypothetical protein